MLLLLFSLELPSGTGRAGAIELLSSLPLVRAPRRGSGWRLRGGLEWLDCSPASERRQRKDRFCRSVC